MAKIEFRGKTYNSEFEMPYDVRQAYIQEKEHRAEKNKTSAKSLSDVVDMSPEVKEIYERAVGKVEEKFEPQPSRDLPRTEDLYRRSAPKDMQNLPSDESIYRPSPPAVDDMKPAIEPESGTGRLLTSILWALIVVAVVFLVLQFVP